MDICLRTGRRQGRALRGIRSKTHLCSCEISAHHRRIDGFDGWSRKWGDRHRQPSLQDGAAVLPVILPLLKGKRSAISVTKAAVLDGPSRFCSQSWKGSSVEAFALALRVGICVDDLDGSSLRRRSYTCERTFNSWNLGWMSGRRYTN